MFVENHSGSLNPAVIAAEVEAAPRVGGHHPADPEPHIEVPPYVPTDEVLALIDEIVDTHRMRQTYIKAKVASINMAKAVIRLKFATGDEDFVDEASKERARKRTDKIYADVVKDPIHPLHASIAPFLLSIVPVEQEQQRLEKHLERLAKQLPVAGWVKQVKGLGMVSFATIVGEAGDIGTYRGPACLWKRMGVAVIAGRRQGAPGEGVMDDADLPPDVLEKVLSGKLTREKAKWVAHGYRKTRRSISWNARDKLILGMGLWRPLFGEDVDANPDLTYFQRLFAKRVRYEAIKCPHKRKDGTVLLDEFGEPVRIKCSDKGKESYSAHAINRAMRYVEKRMLRHLYFAWRRTAAGLEPTVH